MRNATKQTEKKAETRQEAVAAMSLPLGRISLGDNPSRQYKESSEEFAEFKDSVKKLGILQPLLVSKGKKNGEYELVAGYRRYRAAKELKLDSVPVHVTETKKATPLLLNLQENIRRKNLTPIEIAQAAKAIFTQKKLKMPKPGEKGQGTALVAKEMGVSRAYVTEHLKLLSLPEKVQKMVHDSVISANSGFRIANLPEDARDVVIEEAAKIEESKPKPKVKAKSGKGAGNRGERPPMTAEQRRAAEATRGKGGKGKGKQRISDKSVKSAIGKVAARSGDAAVAAVAEKGVRTLADFTSVVDVLDEGSSTGTNFAIVYRKWLKKDVGNEELAQWLTSAFLAVDGEVGMDDGDGDEEDSD